MPLVMAFGGLPMIYSGDEIGLLNDYRYLEDPDRKADNRWMHRALMDWPAAKSRKTPGSIANRIFSEIQKLVELRKSIPVWADYNNSRLVFCDNQHILAFSRYTSIYTPDSKDSRVLALMNFDANIQLTGQEILVQGGFEPDMELYDLYTGSPIRVSNRSIELLPYQFYFIAKSPV